MQDDTKDLAAAIVAKAKEKAKTAAPPKEAPAEDADEDGFDAAADDLAAAMKSGNRKQIAKVLRALKDLA